MKKLMYTGLILFGISMFQACTNGSNNNTDSVDSAKAVNKEQKPVATDASDFAIKAANGGMMEVELGKIAEEKAYSKRVKDFGAMMAKDHSEANGKLKSIASALNVTLPDSLSNESRAEINKLSMKKGKDFDKAYMDMMLDDHKTDIAEFRKAADNLSDSTLKSFASATLPTLEKHLDSAQSITGKK